MFRPGSTPAGPRGRHNGEVHTPGKFDTKVSRFFSPPEAINELFMKKTHKTLLFFPM